MPRQNSGNVEYIDEQTNQHYILPISWSVWDKYTPVVQEAVLRYWVNTQRQGKVLGDKMPRVPDMTSKLMQSPFAQAQMPNATAMPETSGLEKGLVNMTLPIAKNFEGMALAAASPIETVANIMPNARKFYQQEHQKAQEPGIGPLERGAREVGGTFGGLMGLAPLQEAAEEANPTKMIGEGLAAIMPMGGLKGGRNAARMADDVERLARGGRATFNRMIGPSHVPGVADDVTRSLQTSVPRTAIEAMEQRTGGPTSMSSMVHSAVKDTAAMQRFNAGRIEQLTARLRQLPTLLAERNPPNPRTVAAQTRLMRVPGGQRITGVNGKVYRGGQMARVSALTPDTQAFLGLSARDASAALQQLPRDVIENIMGDVRTGVVPRELYRQYFLWMVDDIIEETIPYSNLNISPVDRRAAGVLNTRGDVLMRRLQELSNETVSANGVTTRWNRLRELSELAGVDIGTMMNNIATIGSQLENLQATGKLGPVLERINLSASIPVASAGGSWTRFSGPALGPGAGGILGSTAGGMMGGLPGAAAGAVIGGAIGTSFPTVLAMAVTSPRAMFALRQVLRGTGTAASQFAAAKRLNQILEEENKKMLDTATKQVDVQLLNANKR